MVTESEKTRFREMASLAGWDVAKAYGVAYSGDSDPIRHGGFFYNTADWSEYGYADAVEFWLEEETNTLVVQRGTINKVDDDELTKLIESTYDDVDPTDIHLQIDACKGHWGVDNEGPMYPDTLRFNLDNWSEWRIWRSVEFMLNGLAGK